MKNVLKCLPLFVSIIALGITGCNKNKENESNKPLSAFEYTSYEDIASLSDSDIEAYIRSVDDNGADDNGIIVSPYHTLKVNGQDVPLYGTRTALGIHSFAYLHVYEDKVNLSIEITSLKKKFNSVEILPLVSNVVGTVKDNITTATINSVGSYSFAFNKKSEFPVTIKVAKKEEFVLPSGYNKVEISPKEKVNGVYPVFTPEETNLNTNNTAYYFKKGHYKVNQIQLCSNSVVYFEPGVYLEDYLIGNTLEEQKKDYTALMSARSQSNIKVYGNPLFDYSCHWGGPANHKSKGHFNIGACSQFVFDGAIFINASSWQLCFTNCKKIEVSDCVLFGYKTCSDGIMLSDCQEGHVHHNFVRTGDDAIEAKSTGSQGGKDLIYEYNDVWADKARCYGVIYESNVDVDNIIFRHNTIGFSHSAWADDVGCLVVVLGTNKNVTWQNITFEDIEIYSLKSHALCLSLCSSTGSNHGGNAKNITFKDIRVYCSFITHQELLYIRVEENCSLRKVIINNFQYLGLDNQMANFKKENLTDSLYTKCWTYDGVKATSMVEVVA